MASVNRANLGAPASCERCTALNKVCADQVLEINALKEALAAAKAQAAALQETLSAIESQNMAAQVSAPRTVEPKPTPAATSTPTAPPAGGSGVALAKRFLAQGQVAIAPSVVAQPTPAPSALPTQATTANDAAYARRLQAQENQQRMVNFATLVRAQLVHDYNQGQGRADASTDRKKDR